MKKRFTKLSMVLFLVFCLTACNSGNSDDTSSQPNSNVADADTESQSVTDSQPSTEPETSTEPEKVYDVYVNGVGYDIGVTLELVTTLKAPDTAFTSCCPSYNFYIEGVTDMGVYYSAIEFNESYLDWNPLLISNVSSYEESDDHLSYWSYYDLLATWEDPNAEPLDITDGIHITSPKITIKEAGNYTITITSGNGAPEMADSFAQYDDCFTIEIKEVK